MKKSEIKFQIELDQNNIPDKILWQATDGPSNSLQETKSIAISLWDPKELNTMRIDLWTKDMTVYDMKRFYIEILDGMADGIANATGDEVMAKELRSVCSRLAKHVEETSK
jgi:gliding motility-associated protein GldC